MFLQIMYLGCVWKWIRSREQNSELESRHASLYSVKVIKMSRLTINRFLFYGCFMGCFIVVKQTVQPFLYIDMQELERGQLQCTQKRTRNHCAFNCAYTFACSRLKFWCLRLTESKQAAFWHTSVSDEELSSWAVDQDILLCWGLTCSSPANSRKYNRGQNSPICLYLYAECVLSLGMIWVSIYLQTEAFILD